MSKLSLIDKLLYFINTILVAVLLVSYSLSLVPPKTFASPSVLSLGVPFLILINVLFFLYWLIKLKKHFITSLFALVIGYISFGSLYKFSASKNIDHSNNITVMNYNVRLFNLYHWLPSVGVDKKIAKFITKQSPDVLSMQEYTPNKQMDLPLYKYKYEKLSGKTVKTGQAIFSKFPIINKGSIQFKETNNNAIFIDIARQKDTIRVYNIHLESLRVDPNLEHLTEDNSEKLFNNIGLAFKKQQSQTELFLKHKKQCPYKMIICGDFNNTAFSYVYRKIKGDLNDAFKAAGNGFGRTYDFKFFPIRIDFILADKRFAVNKFKTFDKHYSDHYPIMSALSLN